MTAVQQEKLLDQQTEVHIVQRQINLEAGLVQPPGGADFCCNQRCWCHCVVLHLLATLQSSQKCWGEGEWQRGFQKMWSHFEEQQLRFNVLLVLFSSLNRSAWWQQRITYAIIVPIIEIKDMYDCFLFKQNSFIKTETLPLKSLELNTES